MVRSGLREPPSGGVGGALRRLASPEPALSEAPGIPRLRPELPGVTAWVLTDGKAGDEEQCLAVADSLGLRPAIRRVAPRAPFLWVMPWGPIEPRERPERPDSPISPPFPDLVIASGRRAIPYVRALKKASGGRTFTTILKDPRTGPRAADLIWAPSYDRIRGPNVLNTLTSPNRVASARLAAAVGQPDPRLAGLPGPRLAVLVGGPSRHARFEEEDGMRLLAGLQALIAGGTSLMITPSRRTPERLRRGLRELASSPQAFVWEGQGDNPFVSILALADAILVTADSVNMISEAVATGAPVLLFELAGQSGRHRTFLDELRRHGAVRPFRGKLERFAYDRLDSTPLIAEAVVRAYLSHRARIAAASAAGPGRSS